MDREGAGGRRGDGAGREDEFQKQKPHHVYFMLEFPKFH
jgi:hypothetical protein